MELQRSAQIMGKELKAIGVKIKHTDLLEMVAKATGHASWKDSQIEEQTFEIPIEMCFEPVDKILEVKAKSAKEAFLKVYELNYHDCTINSFDDEDIEIDNTDVESSVEILLEKSGEYHITDAKGKVHIITEDEVEAGFSEKVQAEAEAEAVLLKTPWIAHKHDDSKRYRNPKKVVFSGMFGVGAYSLGIRDGLDVWVSCDLKTTYDTEEKLYKDWELESESDEVGNE